MVAHKSLVLKDSSVAVRYIFALSLKVVLSMSMITHLDLCSVMEMRSC